MVERQELKELIIQELDKKAQKRIKDSEENFIIKWFVSLPLKKKQEIYYFEEL